MTRKEIKKLDELWSRKVREIGFCQKCKSRENLQAAHIFSRVAQSTRWNLENGICLCVKCHLYWAHKEPIQFTWWIESKIGKKKLKELQKLNSQILKQNFQEVWEYLNGTQGSDLSLQI